MLNPEDGAEHIQPQSLRERRFASRVDLENLTIFAAKVKAQVKGLSTTIGELSKPHSNQKWVGISPNGCSHAFVGRRAEMWQVHDGLAAGSVLLAPTISGPAPGDGSALLRGLGGMGKTLLAQEYCRRFSAAWPGGIFWLKAGGELAGQYLMLANELGASFDPADPLSLKRAVTDAMAARHGAYLWVVDDLPHGLTAEQARAWFAPTEAGRTLITTRTRTLDTIARPVELAELNEDEAFHLLTLGRAPKDGVEKEIAYAIIAELGFHALAVDMARHLVRLQGYTKVLADLQNPSTEALSLAERLSVELPTGHEKSITQTFLHSIKMLDTNALDALRIAAHLAPHTPIPQLLLTAILAHTDSMEMERADEEMTLALDQIAAHSLCEIIDENYVVHALVCRTIALQYADMRSKDLLKNILEVLTHMLERSDDARNHQYLANIIPHAHTASTPTHTAEQAIMLNWLARYCQVAGLYSLAIDYISRAREVFHRILGPDHFWTLTSINNQGEVLRAVGKLAEARILQEQVVEARVRINSLEDPDTLASMNNLAYTLCAQGEFSKARKLQEQTLAMLRSVLGPDHQGTLTCMSNLAATLFNLGDLEGARELQEQELNACRRILGPDHSETLISMNNLANILHAQGDFVAARDLHTQELEICRHILGLEHPETLLSMNNLAETLRATGDLRGARVLHEEVLEARNRISGVDHPDTLTSVYNLGAVLALQKDLPGSKALLERAFEGRCRILGPSHPHTRLAERNLSAINGLYKAVRALDWLKRLFRWGDGCRPGR